MELIIVLIPLITAVSFWLTNSKKALCAIHTSGALMLTLMTIYINLEMFNTSVITVPFSQGLFYLDSLSVIMLDAITAVCVLVCIYIPGYLNQELHHGALKESSLRLFYFLTWIFIFTMVVVVSTQNLGIIWIAIEATTLASAFLVGFYNNRKSIEAAWKYIILCSVGIAFALLGIVLIYYSTVNSLNSLKPGLDWTLLMASAKAKFLEPSILKMAFIFILMGFGTKAGLFPMHTWLPDAHSQAPSPISAMLSGVLLNGAIYGILRVTSIVNVSLSDTHFTTNAMVVAGLLSVAAAAVFILPQRDYKRLLAYSSIEHMGILIFTFGMFTPLSLFAGFYHMLNHAFTKSMLFLCAGNVYMKYGTREIPKIRGLLRTMPVTGPLFMLGLLAIGGMPPFSVFFSEFSVIAAAFTGGYGIAGAIMLVLIALVFAGIASTTMNMFFGEPSERTAAALALSSSEAACTSEHDAMPQNKAGVVVICVLFAIITVTGLFMPQPLKALLDSAVTIVRGGM